MREVFRKYDVRGLCPGQLDGGLALRLGAALAARAGGPVAVGRDCRPTGGMLVEALAEGVTSSGLDVIDLGVQTTPMTYFAAHTLGPAATVMVTGSHNPPEYNGFKIMLGLDTLHGEELQGLADDVLGREPGRSGGEGTVTPASVEQDYVARLLDEFSPARSLTVVVDGGHGTGGPVACRVLSALGCRVQPLYCTMDGTFPAHHPDPTVDGNLEELRSAVVRNGADLGIAFDGDADRLGVVDEGGGILRGDRLLIVLARELLRASPGATVISEVKASRLLFEAVEEAGGRAVMCPTGHSIIKEAMRRENALLAGEMSGHVFYRDRYYGFDDALYAALRLVEAVASSPVPLSGMLSDLPEPFCTPEIREDCPDRVKFRVVERVRERLSGMGLPVDATDGARFEMDDGWGLVRASNTQPVLVLRFEAATSETLSRCESLVRELIQEARRESDAQGSD